MSKKTRTHSPAANRDRAVVDRGQPQLHTRQRARRRRGSLRRRRFATAAVVIGVAIGALAIIYSLNSGSGNGGTSAYAYEIADPKPGAVAPPLRLTATDGSIYDLAEHRGKTVLLYFQEGLGCQPCWDQLRDIEADFAKFESIGIDEIVTVTSNPLDLLRQKAADEGLTTPLLSDPDLSVSASYGGNRYGMMGTSTNGHSFILVDGEGMILWRADYGGPPKYTMYVPIQNLVAEIRDGLDQVSGSGSTS